jgi:hypothetical protein
MAFYERRYKGLNGIRKSVEDAFTYLIRTKCNAFCTHSGVASARRITVLVWVQNSVNTTPINQGMESITKSRGIVKDIDYPKVGRKICLEISFRR